MHHPSSSSTLPQSSPSQSPSADNTPPVPSLVLSNLSDVNHNNLNVDGDGTKNSSGGMSPAKKAGIVLGLIVG
ncbi:hypothetical protein Pyn_20763 [Prunus yedoensis var. nudiflora]|uniref:Uncharacterized protein n=1 Tax=Prunus yedoensis var. nudiflora TaxID=2094558 RepID=A0A314Z4H2_PRUYE|nr:hypothetical protein Pyn_20763 [Prunus yedoensis var. nudiflora]